MVNGRILELPTQPDGSVDSDLARKAAGVPDDRPMVILTPDGTSRVVYAGEHVLLRFGEDTSTRQSTSVETSPLGSGPPSSATIR
jgi:hypothetical protein